MIYHGRVGKHRKFESVFGTLTQWFKPDDLERVERTTVRGPGPVRAPRPVLHMWSGLGAWEERRTF